MSANNHRFPEKEWDAYDIGEINYVKYDEVMGWFKRCIEDKPHIIRTTPEGIRDWGMRVEDWYLKWFGQFMEK